MKHLIDKKKFMAEFRKKFGNQFMDTTTKLLDRHTTAMVDEPHYPSGKDRDKINNRNDLRRELRNG